jgi:hypothetical protein
MTEDGMRHQYMPIVVSGFAYETAAGAVAPYPHVQAL